LGLGLIGGGEIGGDAFANGILAGEVLVGEGLVDDDDGGSVAVVGICEETTVYERDFEGGEEVGRTEAYTGAWGITGGGGPAIDGEADDDVAVGERYGVRIGGGLDAGDGGEAGLELIGEAEQAVALETLGRHADSEGDEVGGVEARIY
jgi:hypothetical protein